MNLRSLYPLVLACAVAQAQPALPQSIVGPAPARLTAVASTQLGNVPAAAAAAAPSAFLLAKDPEGTATLKLSFDGASLRQPKTALARLKFSVAAVVVRDHFLSGPGHLGDVHVYYLPPDGTGAVLVGSTILPPRTTRQTEVIVDVTPGVAQALRTGPARLTFELRLGGAPGYGPLYRLAGPAPVLEVFPPNSSPDAKVADERVIPVASGPTVYREPCLPMTESRGSEVVARLLYPVARVREVIRDSDGLRLEEGRDWVLRNGQMVFPAGTRAPVQFAPEFFALPAPQAGTAPTPPGARRTVRLEAFDETWYRARQVEITYDPAQRDWNWPAPVSNLGALPRLSAAYAAHRPITIVHFGDSISFGHNATGIAAVPPYQPIWGDLVARAIAQRKGVRVTYLNHSHSGGTSQWGAVVAAGLVGAEKPDLVILAFGMNDRAPQRLAVYQANMEKIIDSIRTVSPDTEFLVVSTMMNNPAQPGGTGPVFAIHDQTLRISRPGVAFADVTSAERAMLEHKNYLDLSGNGANHPNDFMVGIYAQEVLRVLAPSP